ncbi:hypothetical protein DEI99_005200 [Curtobacterium sp. MCLR17_036]|uniref:hypothetical protein n=1 Tax=Curtobacterium sp. MCLR17_036 TaxID=2175620 RepID=UPI000DA6E190|nr:hypothetical protein [Curtobacterium sp. MCLR17_036]WIE65936.1 hypothetical protein DEI99_005200 [Curtobacterium sp. MCLR17_036]
MTEEQYHVIADATMNDLRAGDLAVVRVAESYEDGAWSAEPGVVRIERPVPTTDEPVHDATPEEIAESLLPPCGFDTEAYAQAHNDGYDTAVAQELQDHPVAFAAALRAAADRIEQEQPDPHPPTREQIAEAVSAEWDRTGSLLLPLPEDRVEELRDRTVDAVLALIQDGADR